MGIEHEVALRRQEYLKKLEDAKGQTDQQDVHVQALETARSFHKDIYSKIVDELVKTNKTCVEGKMLYPRTLIRFECPDNSIRDFPYIWLFKTSSSIENKRRGLLGDRYCENTVTIRPRHMSAWTVFFDEFDKLNRQENIQVTWYLITAHRLERLTKITRDFKSYSYSKGFPGHNISIAYLEDELDFEIHFRYRR